MSIMRKNVIYLIRQFGLVWFSLFILAIPVRKAFCAPAMMNGMPDLAPLVDYLETSQPCAYPTQSKKFADRLISLMQEALMNEESTLTGQEIVTQLAEEFGNK